MRATFFATTWLLLTGLSAQLPQRPSDTVVCQAPETTSIAAPGDTSYWLADIKHQGVAAFNPNPSGYKVFRNVKDYGAKGILPLSPIEETSLTEQVMAKRTIPKQSTGLSAMATVSLQKAVERQPPLLQLSISRKAPMSCQGPLSITILPNLLAIRTHVLLSRPLPRLKDWV